MLAKRERIFCWLTESRVWLRHVDMSCVCASSPNKMQRVHRHVTGQALTAQLSHWYYYSSDLSMLVSSSRLSRERGGHP